MNNVLLKYWQSVSIMVLTMVLAACASTKQPSQRQVRQVPPSMSPAASVQRHPLSELDSLRYQYFYMEAVRQHTAENYTAAFELLRHCQEINPDAPEPWFMLALYWSELHRDTTAVRYLEKAAAMQPDNSIYQERLAQFYIGTRDYEKAKQVYEHLAATQRDRTDVLGVLIQFYQRDRDYPRMLSVINRLEQMEGVSEELTLSKMRVYEMQGDKQSAFKALKELSDKHPNDLNYKVMMGNWLMQNQRVKEAYKIFNKALNEEPDNFFVQSSMYDYYRTVGQDSLAKQMMESLLMSSKSTTESKVTMFRQLISENEQQGGDSTVVLDVFNRSMANSPKDVDLAELKVAYMNLKRMPEDSINKGLRYVLDIAPENTRARLSLLQAYIGHEDWQQVIDICQGGTAYTPDQMVFYYYQGLAYYQLDDKDNALGAFQRGVSQINKESDKDIVADFYYFMGDIMHQKNLDEQAFAAYDSCLQWKDDHVPCLNNYAYYLSIKNTDLSRAEQMSYKTVKAEPKNATYLDTYAWILFMQERYEEARIYIDQAVACDTDSVQNDVILEHAGDIYIMLGQEKEALSFWQRALDAGSESPMVPRKMKEKQYLREEE